MQSFFLMKITIALLGLKHSNWTSLVASARQETFHMRLFLADLERKTTEVIVYINQFEYNLWSLEILLILNN